jgi:dihydroneopterin aldolase
MMTHTYSTESYIFLHDLHFFAYHGVGEQEQKIGNDYRIDLRLKYDISKAAATDDIDAAVSYADVCEAVGKEMNIPSRLLEHVAQRIVDRLFSQFPSVEAIDLTLAKRNPPMGADIKEAGVELHCTR